MVLEVFGRDFASFNEIRVDAGVVLRIGMTASVIRRVRGDVREVDMEADHWMGKGRGILVSCFDIDLCIWSWGLNGLFRGLNGIDHVRDAEMSLCREQAEAVDEELEIEGQHDCCVVV